jgi:D-aspartate ligase
MTVAGTAAPAVAVQAPPRRVSAPGGALILGADYRALGAARSFGRRGVPVAVIDEPAERLAAKSRYAHAAFTWPAAAPRRRVDYLLALAEEHDLRGWALIPSADETAALIARNHAELASHYAHTIPPWRVLRWAYDKRLTHGLAQRLGIACSRTVCPGADIDRIADLDCPFPAVIKPAVKRSFNRLTAAKAWRVDGPDELRRLYAEAMLLADAESLMVQELVPGGGDSQLSYAALCRDGEVIASLAARRTRQYPADFGRASTYVETIPCHDELASPSGRILRHIGFTGLIELEFKRDPRDGELKLLDMNPRLWGWHTLCARAGVDFPYLLWLALCGLPVPAVQARPGVGWLRFTTDTPTALREIARGRLGAWAYARSWASPHERAIFAWDDPRPGLWELPLLTRTLVRRLARREGV